MRHLATFCLVACLALAACGPRPQPFPSASQAPGTSSPTPLAPTSPPAASPEAATSPTAQAASAEAREAARTALELLWRNQTAYFHDKALLEARREDTSIQDIQNALVDNLALPSGSIKQIQQISRADFELVRNLHSVGIFPSPEVGQLEQDRFGSSMQESWWRIRGKQREVLAAVVLVPQDGKLRVQSLLLRSQALGTSLKQEAPGDRQQVLRVLELVQAGKADELYAKLTSAGLRRTVPLDSVRSVAVQLQQVLPEGKLSPTFKQGWHWFSSDGWTRSYRYSLPGRKGPLEVQVNLLQDDRSLAGMTWNSGNEADSGKL